MTGGAAVTYDTDGGDRTPVSPAVDAYFMP